MSAATTAAASAAMMAATASSSSSSNAAENASRAMNATSEAAVNSGSDFAFYLFFLGMAFVLGIWLAVIFSEGDLQ